MSEDIVSPFDMIDDFDPHLPSVEGYALLTDEDGGKFPINECVVFEEHHSTPLYTWKMVGPFIVESLICAECVGLTDCTEEHVSEYAGVVTISVGRTHPILDRSIEAANDPYLPTESKCETEHGKIITFERRYQTSRATQSAYNDAFDSVDDIVVEFTDLVERGTFVPLYNDQPTEQPSMSDQDRREKYNEMLESVQSDSELDGYNEVT